MRKLIVGNWKMNGLRQSADALVRGILDGLPAGADVGVALCPPATLLASVAEMVRESPVEVGGQDCHPQASGAHTGDIAASMLADAGASYVIVGHSERRSDHGESDTLVRAKAEAALASGLRPIVCIGETAEQRRAGEALAVIKHQLAGSLPAFSQADSLVVAYEPVWAIGTGDTATPADVEEVHALIRTALRSAAGDAGSQVPILYGGSVKPTNAGELLGTAEVDGALVGGASLKAEDFLGIITAAAALN